MKLAKIFIALLFIVAIGGFIYLAITDVPITQTEISQEIPKERYLND